MNLDILIANLTNPTLLFFALGIFAVKVKSDLEIPAPSAKFISLYLLFAIGFKGGVELSNSAITMEIIWSIIAGIALSALVPLYTFFILKRKLNIYDAGAIAAAYGSVSAVTFIAGSAFLDSQRIDFGGHMVAVMALMEAPAIIVGVLLMLHHQREKQGSENLRSTIIHSFTNGSVLLIMGSLVIGILANEKQAEGIKPFTTDIFQGFLAIFLLEMGMVSGKKLSSFWNYGWFSTAFAIVIPIINGCTVAILSGFIIEAPGNRFMLSILAASASYIAVPAAMKLSAPKADPGLFIPMALAITFPFNITLGMPLYLSLINLS